MADLFSVTAPLVIRLPDGSKHVMAERFRHPQGLLFFRPFWHLGDPAETIQLVEGEIRGEGPWKVGNCVVTVTGCYGSDPQCALDDDVWREYRRHAGAEYPARPMIEQIARARGAIIESGTR